MKPERIAQLVAFLQKLGLDPTAPGGPGATASGLDPIDEALSHSSLGQTRNHERLEFLGECGLAVGRHGLSEEGTGSAAGGRAIRAEEPDGER